MHDVQREGTRLPGTREGSRRSVLSQEGAGGPRAHTEMAKVVSGASYGWTGSSPWHRRRNLQQGLQKLIEGQSSFLAAPCEIQLGVLQPCLGVWQDARSPGLRFHVLLLNPHLQCHQSSDGGVTSSWMKEVELLAAKEPSGFGKIKLELYEKRFFCQLPLAFPI